jgi:hypothetical protein
MTTTTGDYPHATASADARCWQISSVRKLFVGAGIGVAAVAVIVLCGNAQSADAKAVVAAGAVRLAADRVTELSAQAPAAVGPQFPQTPPSLVDAGGFAADGDDDQAQLQEQQALQQMQQAEQQAEQQEEQANLQAQLAEQQGQQTEQQATQSVPGS